MGKLTGIASRLGAPSPRLIAPPKLVDPFYKTREWLALVDEIIRERGARCERPDCKTPQGQRLIGDHIEELKDGGAKLDKANVRILCLPCHNAKTAARKAVRLTCR